MHTERNMKKWISLFGVVFVTLWLAGCSAESNVKKGDKFYAIGEYFEAAAEYRKAYMRTKPKERAKRGERAYKAADCYRRQLHLTGYRVISECGTIQLPGQHRLFLFS